MKFCSNCGKEITEEGTTFCSGCGTKVDRDSDSVNQQKVSNNKFREDGKKYAQLQIEKIRFKKNKLKTIKVFVQDNLVVLFFLNLIAYILLTIAPAKIGWIYITILILWTYLYPLLTQKSQLEINKSMENNILNSDIIIKKYFENKKIVSLKKEEEESKAREREQLIQIDKELAMQTKIVAEQEEKELLNITREKEDLNMDENTFIDITIGGKTITKKKSRINTIILFLGMLPILVVVSVLISSDYLFLNVTGSLLLPSLMVSFISSLIYYIPTFVSRGTSKIIIFVINLLFGWSIIGWIVCLVWAMNDNSKYDMMQMMQQNNKISVQSRYKTTE